MSVLGAVFGAAAIATGVAIAGKILFDTLSDYEVQKQERMADDYNSYCSERRTQYYDTVESYRRSYESSRDNYNRKFAEEQRRRIDQLKERNRSYLEKIRNNLNEQRNSKQADLDQLNAILEQWESIKDKSQSTMLRMKSIKKSILAIEEACYKLQAYFCYLDRYEHNMDYHFNLDGSIPAPFSMTLPEYYPYPGKIFELRKSLFYKLNDTYVYDVTEEKNLRFFLDKNELSLFENMQYEKISFMVCYNKQTDKLANMVSLRRAQIKLSISSTQGVYAEVEKVNNNWITLSYEGLYLSLRRSDLVNPSKPLPKGTYLTVFLAEYNFALKGYLKVSEKLQDSIHMDRFQNIGMVLSIQQYNSLYQKLMENNWLDFEDEWRIGPVDLNESPVKHVKLQMGDYYGYLAEFKSISENGMILEYQRMLEKEEFMTYTDIFTAADVTVECHPNKAVDLTDMSKECTFLYAYLTSEFTSQKRILRQSPMMLYFDKWLELTRRLIEVLQYKKRITVEINSWEEHGRILYLYVSKCEELARFLKQDSEAGLRRYVISVPNGKKEEHLKCHIDNEQTSDEYLITVKGLKVETLIEELDLKIDLILLSNVYAERSQITAFSEFREGHVSNIDIKEIILQPSELLYHDSEKRITSLYNGSIENNDQQFIALHRAFAAEDFYMIQGPPGTGKTTVIKELIMQQLHYKPTSRILVVSQANVAVDNVLRGIHKLCQTEDCVSESQIIRCGSDDKIAEDIVLFSYKGRMEKYAHTLKTSVAQNALLREKWIAFTENPDNKNIVGECLLRGYQIIGATCVGFSNRNIGLSGLDFDLVIIDEAGKALPGELLIPINHAKKLILIGDHKQLPPVVNPEFYDSGDVKTNDILEEDEHLDFFNKSFFERLWMDCPESNKCMLCTQFRMPPAISGLVNLFYDGKLHDGDICSKKIPIAFDSHLVMLDMKNVPEYKEEQLPKSGPFNMKEQELVINLIQKLRTVYPIEKRIVVITPYKNQKKQMIRRMQNACIQHFAVNTIDAFQGDEEDVVIYCMTRSCKPTDYFSDSARLNVAFSRAKNLLIIVGSSDYLQRYGNEHILSKVFQHIQQHGKVVAYSEFVENGFSICNSQNYILKKHISVPESQHCVPPNLTLFEVDEHEIVSVSKCRSCGSELTNKNDILCFRCLNESGTCTCSECGKTFSFPNYLKYIQKLEPPETCDRCRTVPMSCSNCKKEFQMQNFRLEQIKKSNKNPICSECREEIAITCDQCGCTYYMVRWMHEKAMDGGKKCLCDECRKQENVQCQSCGKVFQMQNFRLEQIKKSNKNPICSECREEIAITCDQCGRSYNMARWMHKKNMDEGKKCFCDECRKQKNVRCQSCGKIFQISQFRMKQTLTDGKKLYCSNCWEKISIPCDKCRREISIVKWLYREIRATNRKCLCPICRNRIDILGK